MSTLAEIEAAVEQLPIVEQKVLLQSISERVYRSEAPVDDPLADDPVMAVIGAYHSGCSSVGEDAEDILYGPEGNK